MKRFDARTKGFRETLETNWREHKLLHVDPVVGVFAAVDDVHHRDRQGVGGDAAQVTVEGQFQGLRRSPRRR